MHAGDPSKPPDDYVDPPMKIPFYTSLEDLRYDAELPPIPLSSGEEVLGEYPDKFGEYLLCKWFPPGDIYLFSSDQIVLLGCMKVSNCRKFLTVECLALYESFEF